MRKLIPLLILLVSSPVLAGSDDIVATPMEEVTVVGQPVYVRVKFEYDYGFGMLNPDAEDLEVRFTLGENGKELGWGYSDDDGIAEVLFDPPGEGKFSIFAHIIDEEAETYPVEIPVFVFDQDKPVIVSDIDGTLSDLPDYLIPYYSHEAPTFPDAPEVLRWLSRHANIVYLTNRDDFLYHPTHEFLENQDFPQGPVILNSWSFYEFPIISNPLTPAIFKTEVLKELLDRGLLIKLGIGNANSDALAYHNAEIPGYIFEYDDEEITFPSIRYDSYKKLKNMLKKRLDLP
ncbi:phosphatase domain-containing protein [Bdellovibrionota bacterium]